MQLGFPDVIILRAPSRPTIKGSNQIGLYHIFKIGDLLFQQLAEAGNSSIVHDQFRNRTDPVVQRLDGFFPANISNLGCCIFNDSCRTLNIC